MNRTHLKRLIAFGIIMEGDIINKSPGYVEDKFQECLLSDHPENLLTEKNLQKFNKYLEKWKLLDGGQK